MGSDPTGIKGQWCVHWTPARLSCVLYVRTRSRFVWLLAEYGWLPKESVRLLVALILKNDFLNKGGEGPAGLHSSHEVGGSALGTFCSLMSFLSSSVYFKCHLSSSSWHFSCWQFIVSVDALSIFTHSPCCDEICLASLLSQVSKGIQQVT
jgi:hypothetical protein